MPKNNKADSFLAFAASKKNALDSSYREKAGPRQSSLHQDIVASIYREVTLKASKLEHEIQAQRELNSRLQKQVEDMKARLESAEQEKRLLTKSVQSGKNLFRRQGRQGELMAQFEANMLQVRERIEEVERQHKEKMARQEEAFAELVKEEQQLNLKLEDIKKETKIVNARAVQVQAAVEAVKRETAEIKPPICKFQSMEEAEEYRAIIVSEIDKQRAVNQKFEKQIQAELKAKQSMVEQLQFRKNNQYKTLLSKFERFVQSAQGLEPQRALELWKRTFGTVSDSKTVDLQAQYAKLYQRYKDQNQKDELRLSLLPEVDLHQLVQVKLQPKLSRSQIEQQLRDRTTYLAELDQAIETQSLQTSKYTAMVRQLTAKNDEMRARVEQVRKK